jgi:hypothetical protein
MRKSLFILILMGLPLLLAAQNSQPVKKIPTPASLPHYPQTTPDLQDGGIRTPFSHEEENFYRRAWPIEKSHGAYALILMGSVLAVIFFLLIRKMFKSPPRRPPVQ